MCTGCRLLTVNNKRIPPLWCFLQIVLSSLCMSMWPHQNSDLPLLGLSSVGTTLLVRWELINRLLSMKDFIYLFVSGFFCGLRSGQSQAHTVAYIIQTTPIWPQQGQMFLRYKERKARERDDKIRATGSLEPVTISTHVTCVWWKHFYCVELSCVCNPLQYLCQLDEDVFFFWLSWYFVYFLFFYVCVVAGGDNIKPLQRLISKLNRQQQSHAPLAAVGAAPTDTTNTDCTWQASEETFAQNNPWTAPNINPSCWRAFKAKDTDRDSKELELDGYMDR